MLAHWPHRSSKAERMQADDEPIGDPMEQAQMKELLLQSLEHEKGGVLVYQTALECAVNKDLRKEWTEYLEQTERHVEVLTAVCEGLGLDPGEKTPGCKI